jgi:hypothetical protein
MKKVLLLLLVAISFYNSAAAQSCAPCNIDSLALSPASNYPDGALYPDPFLLLRKELLMILVSLT